MPDDARVVFLSEDHARAWLWSRMDPWNGRAALRSAVATVRAGADFTRISDDEVIAYAARSLFRGSLRAVVPPELRTRAELREEVEVRPLYAKEPALTWIAIRLVDDDDPPKPVPLRNYKVTLPDGSERQGTLDANGYAMLEGVDPGSCEISFTDVDASDWKPL
jgi:hypothetical protein